MEEGSLCLCSGQGGASGYAEEILRPDLLIVEGGRSQIVNPKRRDRETALLGERGVVLDGYKLTSRSDHFNTQLCSLPSPPC